LANYIVAITGASGSIYGVRLIEVLLPHSDELNLLSSNNGKSVLKEELNLNWQGNEAEINQKVRKYFNDQAEKIKYYHQDNFFSPLASGSSRNEAMIVIPCSMGSLARISQGYSANLIERAADVIIKERRKLILVPRETPLSQIHLANMLKLSQIGVDIVPAMPAFYNRPETIDDLVNFVVARVLDLLEIPPHLNSFPRWGEERKEQEKD